MPQGIDLTDHRLIETDSGTLEIQDANGNVISTFTQSEFHSDVVRVTNGMINAQRGAPTTSELPTGTRLLYTSDGTDGHTAGDLVSARNNAGTIIDQVIAPASNDT